MARQCRSRIRTTKTKGASRPACPERVQALNPAISKPSKGETASRPRIPDRLDTLGSLDTARCEKDSGHFRGPGWGVAPGAEIVRGPAPRTRRTPGKSGADAVLRSGSPADRPAGRPR